MKTLSAADMKQPLNLIDADFINNRRAYYRYLREESPVHQAKIFILKIYVLSRYNDCVELLRDPRFVRNRTTATGGRKSPIPLPKSLNLLTSSMILEDDPEHRRLRDLVHQAFIPRRLRALSDRIEQLTHELLDQVDPSGVVNLQEVYCRPIPVTVIAEMVGVAPDEVPKLAEYMDSLANGFSGWRLIKTGLWDLPKSVKFVRGLIERKRSDPQDDILTGLIQATDDAGDKLSEDELIAMVFLLIVAGHETTVHLITNAVVTLLTHPQQFAQLKANPELMDTAIEEILRYNGPIHGTKLAYATEDVKLHGVTIPKGAPIMPLLGAANLDPDFFDNPDQFDITRSPNQHLGFGKGIHYCLGAPLARIETKIALRTLFDRYPDLRLDVPEQELVVQKIPGWHRYASLPVLLR
jgi:cytochrome P450